MVGFGSKRKDEDNELSDNSIAIPKTGERGSACAAGSSTRAMGIADRKRLPILVRLGLRVDCLGFFSTCAL